MTRWSVPGAVLSDQNTPLPQGVFLLPVCIDAAGLNRLLTAAYYGSFRLPVTPHDDESGLVTGDFTHLIPLLEAMAHIGESEYTCE